VHAKAGTVTEDFKNTDTQHTVKKAPRAVLDTEQDLEEQQGEESCLQSITCQCGHITRVCEHFAIEFVRACLRGTQGIPGVPGGFG